MNIGNKHVARREPIFTAPTIVLALIAVLVIVHAVRQWLSYADDVVVLTLAAFIPARLGSAAAQWAGGITAGYTSLLTHAFLHGDWLHLTVNSAWLLAFGSLIARRCGPIGFLALFAGSAIAGALFFYVFHLSGVTPLVGASGGVSGLMGGAFRVLFSAISMNSAGVLREHPNAIPRMPLSVALLDRNTMLGVGLWLGINLFFGLGFGDIVQSGEIAWEAHVGGFLFGFLLFRWFDKGPGYKEFRARRPGQPVA